MTEEKIARINALAKKSKTAGLTEAEKAEQPDGTIHKVTRRTDLTGERS